MARCLMMTAFWLFVVGFLLWFPSILVIAFGLSPKSDSTFQFVVRKISAATFSCGLVIDIVFSPLALALALVDLVSHTVFLVCVGIIILLLLVIVVGIGGNLAREMERSKSLKG